jgi:hypothetical protein
MINPNDFINITPKKEEPEEELTIVGGSFVCQECFISVEEAKLNEDSMTLLYICKDGHKNEASL